MFCWFLNRRVSPYSRHKNTWLTIYFGCFQTTNLFSHVSFLIKNSLIIQARKILLQPKPTSKRFLERFFSTWSMFRYARKAYWKIQLRNPSRSRNRKTKSRWTAGGEDSRKHCCCFKSSLRGFFSDQDLIEISKCYFRIKSNLPKPRLLKKSIRFYKVT